MNLQKKPLVTIITLSYRKYCYIYDTIKSVLNQDYPNLQYIISDDGAPNCPRKEIELYVKNNSRGNIKNFLFLTRKKNVGTVKNLNQAVAEAKGEYIIHLSADDVFYNSNIVTRIVDAFQVNKCDVIGTLRIRCDEKLNPIRYMPAKFYQSRIMSWKSAQKQYEFFVTNRYYEMASGSVLNYKKSYWEKRPFDESYVLWEDGPFIERYLREGNFLHLDYSFPAIYYREGGISTGNDVNPLLKKDSQLYIKTVYDQHRHLLGKLSTKLLESFVDSAFDESDILSWMKRNVKYFYLAPIKFYYLMEKMIVYKVESFLIQKGIMKL